MRIPSLLAGFGAVVCFVCHLTAYAQEPAEVPAGPAPQVAEAQAEPGELAAPSPSRELDDPAPLPPEYRALIERALAEYNAGNYAEARGLMARAHAMYPNARTLRGLGMVEFELRHYAASVGYLEAALASEERPLAGPLRDEVSALLARATGYVGRVRLALKPSDPPALRTTLNGIPIELPRDRTLLLDVGDHFISVSAAGYLEARRAVTIMGGEKSELDITLQTAPTAERERVVLAKKWWFWTVVGVAAAGVATSVTVGLMRNRDREPPIEGNYPPGGVVQVLAQ